MSNSFAWLSVLGTVSLTVYGQLVIKWRVVALHVSGRDFWSTFSAVLSLFKDPWVLSGFAAALGAAICWMIAMTKLPLSLAYPFTGLAVLLVSASSILAFNETISLFKCAGIALVIAGLLVLFFGQANH